jgi:hypothetical protein
MVDYWLHKIGTAKDVKVKNKMSDKIKWLSYTSWKYYHLKICKFGCYRVGYR